MCGIVGIVSSKPVAGRLIQGLRKLEYRGYDSSGIAVIAENTVITRKSPGKIINLETLLEEKPINGTVGIAHTRWATHGVP
ncbi:MAG: glutamine--fructose-6-phosphate aminotransferase, partial [Alphaproteobacteria bacterium]|nr:glutamine--fructose-6-phosphate aminotransferase [Alphaproteobacteria bacterium]